MKRAIALPIVIFLVALLITAPLIFWLFFSRASQNVKGVKTTGRNFQGLTVIVTSSTGTWDLHEFLCASLDECKLALNSGKKWETLSGGAESNHEIYIEKSPEWEGYSFMKLYIEPGWGSSAKTFNATNVSGATTEQFNDAGTVYNAIFVPLDESGSVIEFSD